MKKIMILIVLLTCTLLIAACGSGSGGSDSYGEKPNPHINNFSVFGNDSSVNNREQIVAANNNGTFRMSFNIEPIFANEARIWVSNNENLDSTALEQQVSHVACDYYPFCEFNIAMNCNYNISNMLSCVVESGMGNLIIVNNTPVDITSMINGNQTNLYMIMITDVPKFSPVQASVPVTFRYN